MFNQLPEPVLKIFWHYLAVSCPFSTCVYDKTRRKQIKFVVGLPYPLETR